MGKYDRAMKLLVTSDPKALVEFVLQRARSTHGMTVRVKYIEIPAELSTEFPGIDAEADGLLLITTEDGRRFLVHIEFQSKNDPLMADRLLDYCLRARHKHSPKEGPPLPIISCVIYLRECGQVPEPPLVWTLFDDEKNLVFDYISIKLHELPREELLALNEPGLLPLSLLTAGEMNRTIVKEMFEELLARKLYDLLPIGQTIATWVLGATDVAWLEREYNRMLDFFKDSPAYEWMTEDGRKEGLAQGLEQGFAQGRQEGIDQARQEAAEKFRQIIVMLVAKRFPKLERLAKKQVRATDDIELLQSAIIHISLAQDSTDVEIVLLDLDKEEE